MQTNIFDQLGNAFSWFSVRITKPLTPQEVLAKLPYNQVVVSGEGGIGVRSHVHCLIGDDELKFSNKAGVEHRKLTSFLKSTFNLEGNSDFSIKRLKERKQLIKYILKDGCYVSRGMNTAALKLAEKQSYKKYSKESFAQDLDSIRSLYLVNDDGRDPDAIVCAMSGVIVLKSAYNQRINMNQIYEMVLAWYVRADNSRAWEMASSFLFHKGIGTGRN